MRPAQVSGARWPPSTTPTCCTRLSHVPSGSVACCGQPRAPGQHGMLCPGNRCTGAIAHHAQPPHQAQPPHRTYTCAPAGCHAQPVTPAAPGHSPQLLQRCRDFRIGLVARCKFCQYYLRAPKSPGRHAPSELASWHPANTTESKHSPQRGEGQCGRAHQKEQRLTHNSRV